MLEQELKIYHQMLSEWLKSECGKYVVIKYDEILGFFNTFDAALVAAVNRFGLSDYLIRCIEHKEEEASVPALTLGLINADSAQTNH